MKAISTNSAFIKSSESGKDLSQNKETIQKDFIQNSVDRERSDFPFVNVFIEFLWLHFLDNKIQARVQLKAQNWYKSTEENIYQKTKINSSVSVKKNSNLIIVFNSFHQKNKIKPIKL